MLKNFKRNDSIIIYGYTRVCSEGGYNGKESNTFVFASKGESNNIMYEDYADTFDEMASNEDFDEVDGVSVDNNGNSKMTKDEFMKTLSDSKEPDCDVFGVIQAFDYHVQFEPFSRTIYNARQS